MDSLKIARTHTHTTLQTQPTQSIIANVCPLTDRGLFARKLDISQNGCCDGEASVAVSFPEPTDRGGVGDPRRAR
jgi:hypothetical protein